MTKKTHIGQDWHKEDIKAAIRKQYGSIKDLAEQKSMHVVQMRRALYMSQPKAEGVIAQALGVSPVDIWPSRYTEERLNNPRLWRCLVNIDYTNSQSKRHVKKALTV